MTPKPLTKEEREAIEYFADESRSLHYQQIRDLLADSQFWREAVKNLPVYGHCPSCEATNPYIRVNHRSDCVWKLAQE